MATMKGHSSKGNFFPVGVAVAGNVVQSSAVCVGDFYNEDAGMRRE
jgi:hypothetical protein